MQSEFFVHISVVELHLMFYYCDSLFWHKNTNILSFKKINILFALMCNSILGILKDWDYYNIWVVRSISYYG